MRRLARWPFSIQNIGRPLVGVSNNKQPLFSREKPIRDVLFDLRPELQNSPPHDSMSIVRILEQAGKQMRQELVSKLDTAYVKTAMDWASLSVDDKRNLDLPKPLVYVLDSSPHTRASRDRVLLNRLEQFGVRTVGDWISLPVELKQKFQDDGMQLTLLNQLDQAVRVGLLLPDFKYAAKVEFLRQDPFWSVDEAKTVVQFAECVDDAWVVTRVDCDALCHNYQKMCEWSMKLALQRWNLLPDDHFKKDPKKYLVKIERYIEANQKFKHQFFVRYPISHVLLFLLNKVKEQTHFKEVCAIPSLNRITTCAHTTFGGKSMQGDRISCDEFFQHAQVVDAYLLNLWTFMEDNQMTKDSDPE